MLQAGLVSPKSTSALLRGIAATGSTNLYNRPLFMPGATVSDNEVASSDVLQVTNDEWIGWPGKRRCYTTCRDHNYVRYAG